MNGDGSPMCLDNAFDEAQAKSGTMNLVLQRLLPTEERIEDLPLFVLRYPGAVVRYPDLDDRLVLVVRF